MSKTKEYLMKISQDLGYDGEITEEVLNVAKLLETYGLDKELYNWEIIKYRNNTKYENNS